MKRPHILFDRAASSGAHGLRRRSALAAFQRVRAFLERATDCAGARGFSLRAPRTLDAELRERFPAGGEWHAGQELMWSGGYRSRPGDPQTVVPLDALESIIGWLATPGFAASTDFECLLRDPRTNTAMPYDDDDFSESPQPWTKALLFLEEDGKNAVSLALTFPTAEVDDAVVAVHDVAVDTLGITMTPAHWLRYTPSKRPGKLGTRKKIHFDRNAWVSAPPPHDDAALLAQIVADLDSDDARQIYADLLVARGDPRGTFINAQCEQARLWAAQTDVARQLQLQSMADKLLREHGKAWDRVPGKLKATMRRGFVERVHTDWVHDYTRSASALAAIAPTVTELIIHRRISRWDVGALVASFDILPLRRLSVVVEPGVLATLATVLPMLRRLDLHWDAPEVAGELAELCDGAPVQLDTIALAGPALDGAVLTRLASSTRFPRLGRILLARDALPPADIAQLQDAFPRLAVVER